MRERPILFSGAMVRALLAGTKTQTRRVAKPVKHPDLGNIYDAGALVLENEPQHVIDRACPYGRPGDRLWVRETFMDLRGTGVEHYDSDRRRQRYAFAANCPPGSYSDEARKDYGLKWKPSIHMPRSACRLVLEVTRVRVERLQANNHMDAIAEGVGLNPSAAEVTMATPAGDSLPRVMFRALWEQINGVGAWEANPWVWVVEFRRIR